MRTGYIYYLFLLIAVFIAASCDKPVYKYNQNFEGTWRTSVIYDTILNKNVQSEIVIDGKDGSFRNTCDPCGTDLCNCISYSAGQAVMNADKTQMKIGSNGFPLTIQKEPYEEPDGTWAMKVGGLIYYRQ